MLEVFVDLLGPTILGITGFYVIKKITESNIKLLTFKNIFLIILMSIITAVLHRVEYTGIETFIIFMLNIIIYKLIFTNKIEESTIAVGIMMLIMFVSDIVGGTILKFFFSIDEIRKEVALTLLASILTSGIELIIINIKIIVSQFQHFYNYFQKRNSLMNIIFLILLIIGFCIFSCNIGIFENKLTIKYIVNIISMIVLGLIAYIFIKNINNYNELTNKYDSLFSYVQNFEDWIEKEQLNRHEYKNQLAVLYCLTSEKKVKEKINEILEDNINVDGEIINQLKQLPKGGIKGLMYYKVAIAQKKKINITADVSLEEKSILHKLNEKDIRIICKLIGIYLDNAIEAAEETRKKRLSIEIYELRDKACFVFSNTFKQSANFADRNKKGITTKGEGHGNGLYFASKLIQNNDWLESKQEIIDKYYVQQLIIHKLPHKKEAKEKSQK